MGIVVHACSELAKDCSSVPTHHGVCRTETAKPAAFLLIAALAGLGETLHRPVRQANAKLPPRSPAPLPQSQDEEEEEEKKFALELERESINAINVVKEERAGGRQKGCQSQPIIST